ncbi:DUF2202 domain-containing protein [Thermoplasmatota archaeon]
MKNKLVMITSILIIIILGLSSISIVSGYKGGKNQTNSLSVEEIEGILFIREEEKMARDVYLTFSLIYDEVSIFENIAASEQRHMDAIKNLIDKYNLFDPVGDNPIGIFENNDIQELYNILISHGEISLINALSVGRFIEEYDIEDIRHHIGITNKVDLIRVYENLLEGSYNHLRSFVSVLEQQCGTYNLETILSPDDFNEILNGEKINRKGRN